MGTPAFAVPVLRKLLTDAHEIVGVYTRPDRAAGRGRKVVSTPVKRVALEHGLSVSQPKSLRPREELQRLVELSPEVVVVAAYGLLLPKLDLEAPPHGCLNIHPSMLPRHRGASPVAATLLNGDTVAGVTIMKLDEGLDTGPIVAQRQASIGPRENAEQLTHRLFEIGADLLSEVLPDWRHGRIEARAQDETGATTASRLTKDDGEIDWTRDADHIGRQMRAYYPWPGSYTYWQGKRLKLIEAEALAGEDDSHEPGRVVGSAAGGLAVATGNGVLRLEQLQLEGRKVVGPTEFIQGYPDFVGSTLGSA